jgi:hypothetical protein
MKTKTRGAPIKADEHKKLSFIHARCNTKDKALWVKTAQAQRMKLTEWIVKTLNNQVDKND